MKKFLLKFIMLLACISFVWFVLPLLIYGILSVGNTIGMAVSLALVLYTANFEKMSEAIKRIRLKKSGKIILSLATAVVVLCVGFASVTLGLIFSAVGNKPTQESTVVVLGCQVNESGPSLMLLRRLQAAQEYLEKNPNVNCIVSGGQGSDEPTSEAECMRSWLIRNGIDESRIFIEDKSASTRENLQFSKEIIEQNNLCENITIITNEFHQYRAGRIAKNLGLSFTALSGQTPVVLLPTYLVREILAIGYEWIR